MSIQSLSRISVIVVALLAASIGVHAQAPQRVVFATDWLAQAEHGGFYQAVAEGTYAQVRPRRADTHGRAAGQRAAVAGGRTARRRDGGRAAGNVRDRAGRAGRRDRRDVPEESDGVHRASGRQSPGRPEGQADRDRRRRATRRSGRGCDRNTASPTARSVRTGFPCSRSSPTASCRSRASPRPSRSRSRKAACGPRCSCWPTSAIRPIPRRSSSRARRSPAAADALERFLRASAEGWRSYLANPAPGNALIKQANPQMSDELLAYGVRKMSEYGIVASGDARKFGLLTMTDGALAGNDRFPRGRSASRNQASITSAPTRSISSRPCASFLKRVIASACGRISSGRSTGHRRSARRLQDVRQRHARAGPGRSRRPPRRIPDAASVRRVAASRRC